MKHTVKITVILVVMFFVTQLAGLFVMSVYNNPDNKLPYGMEPPEEIKTQMSCQGLTGADGLYCSLRNMTQLFVMPMVFAIVIFLVLSKIRFDRFIRFWFYVVGSLAVGIFLYSVMLLFIEGNTLYAWIALGIGLILAYFKIYKRNMIVHNLTELAIYPGIGVIFAAFILNLFYGFEIATTIIILMLISIYDIWAVWHSGFMQKMAEYQMDKVKIFAGFFLPYAGKEEKEKIKFLKEKYKNKSDKELEKAFEKEKIKVNLAILGGGDVVFPIIAAGVFYRLAGLIPALIIAASATIALSLLFVVSRKGKFYPAMPFLTIGMYIGMLINYALA